MDLQELIQDTLAKVAAAVKATKEGPGMRKAIDIAQGLYGYSLQKPAQQLVPLMSPFYNSIPRVVKPGANSDNWKQITALSSPELFTSERAAGNLFTTTVTPKTAAFKVSALRGEVTREAQAASVTFDDALAKETANTLLISLKLMGQAYLYANVTDLGTPNTPVVTEVNAVGTIGAADYFVVVVGLTGMAANRTTVDLPDVWDGTNAFLAGRAVLSADLNPLQVTTALSGVGLSIISAQGTVTTTGADNGLRIKWTAKPGFCAYAIFVGTVTGAANLHCEAIVSQTEVTLTSLAGTGVLANENTVTIPTADETGNAKHFDGILPNLLAVGSGAYIKAVNGTLTGALADGEVVQIQQAFAALWRTAKIGKFRVVMSGQDVKNLTKKGIISNAMQIFAGMGAEGRVNLTIGAHVGEILNATTGDRCPVEVEPWAVPGTVFILPMEIPYPMANISTPFQWVGNYDWERWEYASTPTTGPIYPFETRCNGVLEPLFTGGCGVLYNIYNG